MPQVISNPQAERRMNERNKIKSTAVGEMDILLLILDGTADLVTVAKNSGTFGVKTKN